MTRYTPMYVQDGSYAASQDRRLIAALWPTARSTGCAVTVASGMTLNVAAGTVAVPTQNNTGSTLCVSDAVEQVVVPAAPPSGQSRIDLIICRPRDFDLDGSSNSDFIFDVVSGTPAASNPPAPAVPPGTAALYQVTVPGGAAALVAGNLADARPGALAAGALAGQIIMGGWTTPPAGHLACDGSAVSRIVFAGLFAAIATNFGSGDGSTTFGLPNFVGYFPTGGPPGLLSPSQTHSHPLSPAAWGSMGISASSGQAIFMNRRENIPSYQDLALNSVVGTGATAASSRGLNIGGNTDAAGGLTPAFQRVNFVIKT